YPLLLPAPRGGEKDRPVRVVHAMKDPETPKPSHASMDLEEEQRMRRYERLLVDRFPHLQSVSLQLLERSETFRDLCEECAPCPDAFARLSGTASDEALRREYSALRLRVEGELLRYISEHTDAAR